MSEKLKARYRRLLAWYPKQFREQYQEEQLGVLMDQAAPGQTRPGLAQTADLVRGALKTRLRHGNAALVKAARGELSRRPQWKDALAVAGVLGLLGMLVGTLYLARAEVPWAFAWEQLHWNWHPHGAGWHRYAHAASWGLALAVLLAWYPVALTGLFGLRRTTAVLAWVATLGQAVLLFGPDEIIPHRLAFWWSLVGAVVAAGLTFSAGVRHGVRLIGKRWLLPAGLAMVGLILGYTGRLVFGDYFGPLWWLANYWSLVVLLVLLLTGVAVVRRTGPAVGLRAFALLSLPLGALVIDQWWAGWWGMGRIELLLVATPMLMFVAFVLAANGFNRALHLIRLGRAAELAARPGPSTGTGNPPPENPTGAPTSEGGTA